MNKLGTSRIEWFAALCLFVLFYIINGNYQVIVIFGSTFVVFFVYAVMHHGIFSIKIDAYLLYIAIFCLFCYISALWAEDNSYTISKGNLLLEILIAMVVFHLIFSNDEGIRGLLKLIQWGGYIILAYAILRYGWSTFLYVLQNETRISNDYLNANVLGMCAVYSIIINLYFMLYEKIRLTDVLIIPAIVIIAATGSRTAIIILVLGVFALFIIKNFDNKHFLRSAIIITIVVLVLAVLLILILRLPIFDALLDRLSSLITLLRGGGDRSTTGWVRLQYILLGINLFLEHPIIGIGIDNARLYTSRLYGLDHYLHNNYVELAACGGLIGFGLYYSIYIYIFYIMIKYHAERDREWDICMVLLVIRLVAEMGVVSYQTRGTYVFLLLFWLEAQKIKKRGKTVTSGKN